MAKWPRMANGVNISVQFIYFTYFQNIQINLLSQSKTLVTKYDKESLITKILGKKNIIKRFDCKRDKIKID